MDRAPLRGMVLNALILLYGYCQGWGVAFGEERTIRPWHPKRRPTSLDSA